MAKCFFHKRETVNPEPKNRAIIAEYNGKKPPKSFSGKYLAGLKNVLEK